MGLRILIVLLILPAMARAQQWPQLNQKTSLLIQQEHYSEAILMAELAIKAAKKENVTGKELAVAYYNLASAYLLNGQLDKPEAYYLQSVSLYKTHTGEQSTGYANALRALGQFYSTTNQYRQADSLFTMSTKIFIQNATTSGKEYALLENSKGDLYSKFNRYGEAEAAYTKAIETEKARSGERSADYCTYINNLAQFYFNQGMYEYAEPLFLKVKEIRKSLLGENHSQYASILTSLAEFYAATGQHEKAVAWFTEALGITRDIYGPDHYQFAVLVKKSADFAREMNQYKDAELLYKKALSIFKITPGETSHEYGSCCNGMGLLYANMQQFEKARMYYSLATAIVRSKFGESHPDYGSCLNNMALLHLQTENYKEAETLFLQAAAIDKAPGNKNNSNYSILSDNLVKLYTASGQFTKATPLIKDRTRAAINNLFSIFAVLSGNEKEQYLENQLQITAANNSFIYLEKNPRSAVAAENFNLQLQLKSLALADTRSILKSIRDSRDSSVIRSFQEWQHNKTLLSGEYALQPSRRRNDLNSLEEKTELLEKELNRKSFSFRQQQEALSLSYKQVQEKMDTQEVAVEFVSFPLYRKSRTDSVIYAAYILRKTDSLPVFVPLCEEKQLGKYFSATGGASAIKALYRSDPEDETDNPSISGDSLYALIWHPLEPFLTGIKKISYSPSGLLNRVAFQALPDRDSQLLNDRFEMNRYINLRELVNDELQDPIPGAAVLMGNCRYEADSISQPGTMRQSASFNNGTGWKELPGTATELSGIEKVFNRANAGVIVYSDTSATEEALKKLSGHSPSILHIATHGFFLPDPEKKMQEGFTADQRNAFTMARDPLMRSGIVLSGVNQAWRGLPPTAGKEDGIVTAYEIAQLDLSNTELVVLSACETALGDIRGTEGVFGLQRAFKLAGVKKMIVSLWKVPDAESAELMNIFYKLYLQGHPIRNAFRMAQFEMQKKHTPYYWAGFVLIE